MAPVLSEVTDCADPKDNRFLALAFDSESDLILTGDSGLLTLSPWRGIEIVSPRAFLARMSHQLPAADADALALRGRAPSSRFDILSSMPASASSPRSRAGRRLDALATKVGEISGLAT